MKFIKLKKIGVIISLVIFIFAINGCTNNKSEAGIVFGDDSAPIEIINYSSFQCPDCTDLHVKLHETLKKYIQNGDIKFIEKPIDIKRFEADEVIYKHMTSEQVESFDELLKIYESQIEWRTITNEDELISFLNLSRDENIKNVKDLEIIMQEKEKINLTEVPTMYVNGEKISNLISVEDFENMIDNLLE